MGYKHPQESHTQEEGVFRVLLCQTGWGGRWRELGALDAVAEERPGHGDSGRASGTDLTLRSLFPMQPTECHMPRQMLSAAVHNVCFWMAV
jgi:hypothetical protein